MNILIHRKYVISNEMYVIKSYYGNLIVENRDNNVYYITVFKQQLHFARNVLCFYNNTEIFFHECLSKSSSIFNYTDTDFSTICVMPTFHTYDHFGRGSWSSHRGYF